MSAAAISPLEVPHVPETSGRLAPPELAAIGIKKAFGPLVVLEDVSLTLPPGTFHALLGENGAGKSTLVKCIMGYQPADAGTILIDRAEVKIANTRAAQALGIGMVYQHFTLVPNMSVAENLVLARSKLPILIDWRKEEDALRAFMTEMPFQIDPARIVRDLAAGERQKLEILKQLYLGNRILILDEPTSVLTPGEADEVLGMLRRMAGAGEVSVLMITHKFREVTSFADDVTVLRRGRVAGQGAVSKISTSEMAKMMVGGEPPRGSSTRVDGDAKAKVRLALRDVKAVDARGIGVLNGVSLEVRPGEIVGIAGVSGNGQDELLEVIAGQRALDGGEIQVEGVRYRGTRDEARVHKLRCLPEEPLRNACVPTMSVAENIGFRGYDRPPFTVGWLVRRDALRKNAQECIAMYKIKAPSADTQMSRLSGGNVQRSVLARELQGEPRVLVVANPCFGLDFQAVADIRTRLMEARNAGVAVLLISADLDEIFTLADRILVLSAGRVVYETPIATANVATIGQHMAGHSH